MSAPAFRLVKSEDDLPDSPPPGPELDELLALYLRLHPGLGTNAAKQYRNAVSLAKSFLSKSPASPELGTSCDALFSLERVCDFFSWLLPNRSAATVNGRIDVVWMLWKFARRKQLCRLPVPDADEKPRAREEHKDPIAFTTDEIVRLLAACLSAPPMRRREVKWWSRDHWLTLISAYLSSAERFSAMLNCPRSALRENVLLVPAALTKNKKEKPVVITDWIAEKMQRLPVIDGSDLLWPYPFALRQLRTRYTEDILEPAGLPTTRWHKFHCLRRTTITQVKILHGLERASEIARHSGHAVTVDRYVSDLVVQKQTGSVAYEVPRPQPQGRAQLQLF